MILGEKMKRVSLSAILSSLIIAVCLSVGEIIHEFGSLRYLIHKDYLISNIVDFLFTFIIWYFITILIFKLLDKKITFKNKVFSFIFKEHPISMITFILIIIGLPIIITFYPGPVQWDGMWQLNYYSNVLPWSNHHPFVSTFFLGTVERIGSLILNDNFGIFLYTFPQFLFSCYIIANIIDFQNKCECSDVIKLLTFIFFALSPSWYLYAYTFMKDTYYYLIFVIFFINYIKFYFNDINKHQIIIFLISAILLILIRNNGIYVVSVSMLTLLFLKKDYKKISLCFIFMFIITQLILNTLMIVCHIEPGNIRETLSVPIQQIARYTIYNDLTEEEKETIEKLFIYDENDFALYYDKDNADPIKESLYIESKDDLKLFMNLWINFIKKDPITCIDATLNNTYGYFYPYKEDVKESIGYFRVVYNKSINKGNFDFKMNKKFKKFRKKFEENFYKLRRSKYIRFIYNTGTYFIILVILMCYCIYKNKKHYLIITMPLLMTYAFCILSPVNAYLRYMNPIIISIPIFIGVITSKKYNKN